MSVYCAFNRSCLSVSPSILLCFEMINRVEGYPCAVQMLGFLTLLEALRYTQVCKG